MKLGEIAALVGRPRSPAPQGVRRLSRAHSIEDLARLAKRRLPRATWGYLEGGGEDEHTLRSNQAALHVVELVPRVLRDVSDIDTSTTVLGSSIPTPIVLAPVGAPRLFHHQGELAVARAAGHARLPYAISTLATVALEQVASEATGPLWFQLYVWGDRSVAKELIYRATAAGYGALLLTVDCTVRSKRERELRAGVTLPTPHLSATSIAEAALHPTWWWHFLTSDAINFPNIAPRQNPATPDIAELFDGSATWDDLDWIADAWKGPLAIKGIVSVDDARRAVDLGLDALIVSNHGGRQLDHVPATIEVLAKIADAVGDRIEILMDSGIRRGTDVVSALALGARAVLVGRAHLYGLAAAGEAGVRHAIDILDGELRTAMALVGAATIGDLSPAIVQSARTDRRCRSD
jgi:L-lactate dehydrogenase (cytochrome)